MNFDGFLYVFALIGIVTTAVTGSLGIALTLTLARFTYVRIKQVAPLLFPTSEEMGLQKFAQQSGATLDGPVHEPASNYMEKTRMSAATDDGRKRQVLQGN